MAQTMPTYARVCLLGDSLILHPQLASGYIDHIGMNFFQEVGGSYGKCEPIMGV